jgi:type IV pilus assembly protein PilA
MIVVVIIGILAALAIPAFQHVRVASQNKAVLNNMRLLAAAADQYFTEQGTNTARFVSLVGSSAYVKSFSAVAGESYPSFFTAAAPVIVSGVAGARTLTYSN